MLVPCLAYQVFARALWFGLPLLLLLLCALCAVCCVIEASGCKYICYLALSGKLRGGDLDIEKRAILQE